MATATSSAVLVTTISTWSDGFTITITFTGLLTISWCLLYICLVLTHVSLWFLKKWRRVSTCIRNNDTEYHTELDTESEPEEEHKKQLEVSFVLPPLLSLLLECAKKIDQSVLSISLGALVHLIEVGGHQFSETDWDTLLKSISGVINMLMFIRWSISVLEQSRSGFQKGTLLSTL
ncbi:uncharacterized protein LOC141670840 isoform X2 [Apium graveolens]|uniref:uncharacterized protein LOC141670840 isoform X2 n=1 Tax=Apium graveolens TaxID=4045 RepID=UPI003D7AA007